MLTKDHEKPAAFRRMARGEATPAEARGIVRHLLAGCSRCAKLAEKLREATINPASWDYESAFDRVQERVIRAVEAEHRSERRQPLAAITAAAAHH